MTTTAPNCCETVRAGTDGWKTRYRTCTRKGSVERDGKWYCGQHDPQAKASRAAKNMAAWDARSKANRAKFLLDAAAPDLLAACKEFVRKVDAGEAKSRRSYAQMKAAIAKAEGNGA